jgi:thiamine-phosphate pyrophosphorylase
VALNRLYFITGGEAPLEQIGKACLAGVRLIQLRLKAMPDEDFLLVAREAMKLCERSGSRLIINDRVGIAAAVNAHGVHVGKEDLPVREARRLLGPGKIVGGTANTVEDIREHYEGGADYVGLGPYRYTTTKEKLSPILGLEGYRRVMAMVAAEKISLPVFAIGGIGRADVGPLLGTGVYGAAFSGLLVNAGDWTGVIRGLEEELNNIKTI